MDLPTLLAENGIPFKIGGEHKDVRPGQFGVACPGCGPGDHERPYLGLSPDGWANCWSCGSTTLKAALLSIGVPGEHYHRLDIQPRKHQERRYGSLVLPSGVGDLKQPHREYLCARGFNPDELVRLWDLKGIGPVCNRYSLRWRIFIPIVYQGDMVSWTTRAVSSKQAIRYLSASPEEEAYPARWVLYGGDYVRNSVIVCEGPADVWRIGPGAVAVLGSNPTNSQIGWLGRIPNRFVLYDSEPAAQRRAEKLMAALDAYPGTSTLLESDSPDPGSATPEVIQQIRELVFNA